MQPDARFLARFRMCERRGLHEHGGRFHVRVPEGFVFGARSQQRHNRAAWARYASGHPLSEPILHPFAYAWRVVDVYAEFVGIVHAFEAAQIDYAICGALALAVHGAPRATKDIDLIARKDDEVRIRELARSAGFVFEALPMEFSASGIEVQRFTKLVDGRPLMLDILWLNPKLQPIWNDRQRVPWQDGTLSVVSRDGLITLKLTAGRAQDLVDIQSLTAAEGNRGT